MERHPSIHRPTAGRGRPFFDFSHSRVVNQRSIAVFLQKAPPIKKLKSILHFCSLFCFGFPSLFLIRLLLNSLTKTHFFQLPFLESKKGQIWMLKSSISQSPPFPSSSFLLPLANVSILHTFFCALFCRHWHTLKVAPDEACASQFFGLKQQKTQLSFPKD